MTEISPTEIKILFIQVMFVAITGILFNMYLSEAHISELDISGLNQTATKASDQENIIGVIINVLKNVFWIPDGLGDMWLIIALVKVPFGFFDAMITARFVKDMISGWM